MIYSIISISWLIHIRKKLYLCNIIGSFWIKRELGEKPKQSRCCKLHQRNKHFIFCHWILRFGKAICLGVSQKTCQWIIKFLSFRGKSLGRIESSLSVSFDFSLIFVFIFLLDALVFNHLKQRVWKKSFY